jgi:membrane protease YdiL (CAAX protease family)
VSGRLVAWFVFIGVLVAINYASYAAEGKPDRNAVYHYSTAVGAFIQYGLFLGITLAIARGDVRRLLALRQPRSWGQAVRIAIGVLVVIYVLSFLLNPLLHPGEEQGLTPTGWDSSRAGAFVASFIAIAVIGPFVEEAMFRGLGFSLLVRYGSWVAIGVIGLTFGLYHGLVDALPILAAFGAGLAYLRSRTDSLYPCVLLHGAFNAIALIASVTT